MATAQDSMIDFYQDRMGMWILGPWAVPQLTPVADHMRLIPLPQMTRRRT